jgi:hypothetical protein
MAARTIETKNILYHFLQRDLDDRDRELFRALTAEMVSRLGIWMSPQAYQRLPLMVPYARRDSHARGSKVLGLQDQWGAPDENGYFRDDNSLVKGIPRSLAVSSSFPLYKGRQAGSGFVAAHVWRQINSPEGAARNPLTYSFIPNIVWLPAQVAGLSDTEGSFVQQFLQRLSLKVFRDVPVAGGHSALVTRIWELLPAPKDDDEIPLPAITDLSFFEPTEAFYSRRAAMIRRAGEALRDGGASKKVISSRYTEGLHSVAPAARLALGGFLIGYADAILR